MTDNLIHESYCLPRPGETEPRVESYRIEQYDDAGSVVINRPQVTRCIECGAHQVTGALPTVARTPAAR